MTPAQRLHVEGPHRPRRRLHWEDALGILAVVLLLAAVLAPWWVTLL